MANKNQIYVILLLFIFLLSNCSDEEPSLDYEALITDVEVNHVIKYRDWCRFSYIEFNTIFKNNTKDTIVFLKQKKISLCDKNIDRTSHQIIVDSSFRFHDFLLFERNTEDINLDLMILNLESNTTLLPKDSLKIRYRLVPHIIGASLKEILDIYEGIFNHSFRIKSSNLIDKKDIILFNKLENMELKLLLDDIIVSKNDTALMHKMNKNEPRQNFNIRNEIEKDSKD